MLKNQAFQAIGDVVIQLSRLFEQIALHIYTRNLN